MPASPTARTNSGVSHLIVALTLRRSRPHNRTTTRTRSGGDTVKPAPFAYARAKSVEHAIELLARPDGEARLLAGGQSLIATLNMRLSAPKLLIDLNGVSSLAGIKVENGTVDIGALTRHVEAERSADIAKHAP